MIEGIDDSKEDKQSMVAWNYLKKQRAIPNRVICHLHELITSNQLSGTYKGYYRNITKTNVRVGNNYPPDYKELEYLMANWVNEVGTLEPITSHIRFEKIHPFVDGNGRTGRMLLWWQEIMNGQQPTLFKADERQEYYKLFELKELKEE